MELGSVASACEYSVVMNLWFPVKVENYVIELLLALQERLFGGVR